MSRAMHFLAGLLAACLGFVAGRVAWALFDWVAAHGTGRVDEAKVYLALRRK